MSEERLPNWWRWVIASIGGVMIVDGLVALSETHGHAGWVFLASGAIAIVSMFASGRSGKKSS